MQETGAMKRALSAFALLLVLTGCTASYDHGTLTLRERPPAAVAQPVTVGIIALNDFHGALDPPNQSVVVDDHNGGTLQVPAGGAAWLASAVDSIRGEYSNSVTVGAGDLISASQISSASAASVFPRFTYGFT